MEFNLVKFYKKFSSKDMTKTFFISTHFKDSFPQLHDSNSFLQHDYEISDILLSQKMAGRILSVVI